MSRRSVLWVLVVATARAKRRNPPQKPLVARARPPRSTRWEPRRRRIVRVAFDDGCRTLAGDACAGPTPRTNGTEPVTLVLIKATRDCGANGLWHFLNRCVTAAARAAAQRRAALAFVAHDGEPPEEPCRRGGPRFSSGLLRGRRLRVSLVLPARPPERADLPRGRRRRRHAPITF